MAYKIESELGVVYSTTPVEGAVEVEGADPELLIEEFVHKGKEKGRANREKKREAAAKAQSDELEALLEDVEAATDIKSLSAAVVVVLRKQLGNRGRAKGNNGKGKGNMGTAKGKSK